MIKKMSKHYISISISGLSNDEFTFDAAGDGPARYNIIHYRRVDLNAWECFGKNNLTE